jgi:hypothetical protein
MGKSVSEVSETYISFIEANFCTFPTAQVTYPHTLPECLPRSHGYPRIRGHTLSVGNVQKFHEIKLLYVSDHHPTPRFALSLVRAPLGQRSVETRTSLAPRMVDDGVMSGHPIGVRTRHFPSP